ncbi:MAG: hypothetical protein HKN77_03385 [Woeseiaceae bacterium]|nr:hypothetical protein [Woeseiaceae bacterium]
MAGCSSNVVLDPPTIPKPLVKQIPLSIALRMPENFEQFVHEENVLGREEWKIDLGRSNAVFFEQLMSYMFANVTIIQADADPTGMPFDALIEPTIDAFEFSVPNQTKTDAFAVWIRYRVKVFGPNGKLVVNWPVSAYGKSLTTAMGGSEALQRAAVLAMRDAAALLILKFNEKTIAGALAGTGNIDVGAGDDGTNTAASASIAAGGNDE